MTTGQFDPQNLPPIPPWITQFAGPIIMAAAIYGALNNRVANLESTSVRIETKVDQILLQRK